MERSQIKFLIIVYFLFSLSLRSQGLYIPADHSVYSFLERMKAAGIIENYQNETKPLLRSVIVNYLLEIFNKRFQLNSTEKNFLNYYLEEFYSDISGSLDKYDILLSDKSYNPFSSREKFIYAYYEPSNLSLFVKAHLNLGTYLSKNDLPSNFLEGGGRFYGSISKFLGFELDAKNGIIIGQKASALKIHDLSYNFKLNEKPESKFFDRAYGYISIETPYIDFKIGRDRKLIGYGYNRLILSDYPPDFEAINFNIHYKSFSFEYLHGWLKFASENPQSQQQTTSPAPYEKKYLALHRISFSPLKNLRFGIGESVIYLRTSPQLDYLNPLNFYKSIEHQLGDQDNALLFFDVEAIPIKNLRLYSTFLIDDIDFSKIGTRWYGNKTAFNIGVNFYNVIPDFPLHFLFEYSRIEPYTYTHYLPERNYTNYGYSLSTEQPPNSYKIDYGINITPDPKLDFIAIYSFTKWGKNYFVNNDLINVGGDIQVGKRIEDSDYVSFLDGKIETINSFKILTYYEIVRNIKLSAMFNYTKLSSQSSSLILSIGLISFL
ncbi:MAG: hypothetical protein NUV92_09605 [Ignavibacteria bacterium]|jgi:hypothetical protein|nr:hypothetical protein [Ignavibacteria bacterium]MDH7528184.1 capsule assembly Wzi family protein [Ignavibacteria bacterium]